MHPFFYSFALDKQKHPLHFVINPFFTLPMSNSQVWEHSISCVHSSLLGDDEVDDIHAALVVVVVVMLCSMFFPLVIFINMETSAARERPRDDHHFQR